jgi:hypothetical protein
MSPVREISNFDRKNVKKGRQADLASRLDALLSEAGR